MLVLTRKEVEALLDLDLLVEALAAAHAELSSGGASVPPRVAAFAGEAGLLGAMPAYVPSPRTPKVSGLQPDGDGSADDAPGGVLGCKLVSLFPGNRDRPTHQAAIALFDSATGTPVALMDGTYVTAVRTAAASALAARFLARADAHVLAILGTGVQARSHARALAGIRDWDEIRVAGRDPAKAEGLARELGLAAATSYEAAVRGADVVAAVTTSPAPVVLADWVAPGTHVGSVGYNPPGSELDAALVRGATVVVESRASSLAPPPAGAPELAELDPSSVAELGEIVSGTHPGRTSPEEITLYKSVGVAVQDLAAGALVLAAARERGVGLEIELEELNA